MKSKAIQGSIKAPFKYNILENGNISVITDHGLITIPKYLAEKLNIKVEEGGGIIIISYHVRISKENNKITVDRIPQGKDFEAGIGRPIEETFDFNESGISFKRKNTDMDSDIFFDYNKKFDYKNLLLSLIEDNIENGSLGEEIKRRNAKEDWTDEEAEIALEAYFLSLDGDNEDIKSKAEEAVTGYGLERTVASMVMKMLNYRELDPLNDQKGLGNVGRVFKETWDKRSEEYRGKYKRRRG